MFKIVVSGALLILVTVSTCLAGLTWEQREIELSPEPGAKEAKAEFPFENRGDSAVKLTSLKTSCDCTAASLDKTTYAKGESGSIHAKIKLGSWQGTKQKKITVTTDDPTESTILLTLTIHMPAATTQPTIATTRPASSTTQPSASTE